MKPSKKIAIGGMITAISIITMLLTGVFPFATFALPGIAGALLIIPVIELGRSYAFVIYLAVALLSVFVAPDREAAVCYTAILGYYPIVKSKFEQINSRIIEYLLKALLYTIVYIAAAIFLAVFFGLEQLELTVGLLIGGYFLLLFAFIVYDFALSRIISLYIKRIRSSIFKYFK